MDRAQTRESSVQRLLAGDGFGGEPDLADICRNEHIQNLDDVLVLDAVIAADDDIQIGILLAKFDEGLQELILFHLHRIEECLTAVIHGDVIYFGRRFFGSAGRRREGDVQIIDRRRGGDDKDDQQDERQVE